MGDHWGASRLPRAAHGNFELNTRRNTEATTLTCGSERPEFLIASRKEPLPSFPVFESNSGVAGLRADGGSPRIEICMPVQISLESPLKFQDLWLVFIGHRLTDQRKRGSVILFIHWPLCSHRHEVGSSVIRGVPIDVLAWSAKDDLVQEPIFELPGDGIVSSDEFCESSPAIIEPKPLLASMVSVVVHQGVVIVVDLQDTLHESALSNMSDVWAAHPWIIELIQPHIWPEGGSDCIVVSSSLHLGTDALKNSRVPNLEIPRVLAIIPIDSAKD